MQLLATPSLAVWSSSDSCVTIFLGHACFRTVTCQLFPSMLLQVAMPQRRAVTVAKTGFFSVQIERPYMREWAAWRSMVAIMVLSCSGLVRFLLDQYPEDLPDCDPVD
jgi:hypothetical protein